MSPCAASMCLAAVALGCQATTYHIERASLVPMAAPVLAPGDGSAHSRLSIGYATPIVDPKAAPQSTQTLFLPRHSMEIAPSVALGPHTEIHVPFHSAFAAQSIPLRASRFGSPDASGFGGLGFANHSGAGSPFFVAGGLDLLVFVISSKVRVTWDECEEEDTWLHFGPPCRGDSRSTESSLVMGLRINANVGIQGRLGYVYLLLGARNQPQNSGSEDVVAYSEPEHDPEVTSGDFDGTVGVGGALRLGRWAEVVSQVWISGGDGAIDYGPAVSVALTGVFPEWMTRPRAKRPDGWIWNE